MSVQILSRVWNHSQARQGDLLVLLAIADFADDDGKAWPSVQTLGAKSRLSERQTRYALRRLERSGELKTLRNKGPHGCHLYQITIAENTGAKNAGGQKMPGAISDTRGAISGTLGGQSTAPEPSENHHKNRHTYTSAAPTVCAAAHSLGREGQNSSNGYLGGQGDDGGNQSLAVVAAWNDTVGLPRVRNLSSGRKRKLAERLRDPFFRDNYPEAIRRIATSAFCRGHGKNGWKADFDFLLRPDTVARAVEGAFDDRQQEVAQGDRNLVMPEPGPPMVDESMRAAWEQKLAARAEAEAAQAEHSP
jgi:helix-turn-helix protein